MTILHVPFSRQCPRGQPGLRKSCCGRWLWFQGEVMRPALGQWLQRKREVNSFGASGGSWMDGTWLDMRQWPHLLACAVGVTPTIRSCYQHNEFNTEKHRSGPSSHGNSSLSGKTVNKKWRVWCMLQRGRKLLLMGVWASVYVLGRSE